MKRQARFDEAIDALKRGGAALEPPTAEAHASRSPSFFWDKTRTDTTLDAAARKCPISSRGSTTRIARWRCGPTTWRR